MFHLFHFIDSTRIGNAKCERSISAFQGKDADKYVVGHDCRLGSGANMYRHTDGADRAVSVGCFGEEAAGELRCEE